MAAQFAFFPQSKALVLFWTTLFSISITSHLLPFFHLHTISRFSLSISSASMPVWHSSTDSCPGYIQHWFLRCNSNSAAGNPMHKSYWLHNSTPYLAPPVSSPIMDSLQNSTGNHLKSSITQLHRDNQMSSGHTPCALGSSSSALLSVPTLKLWLPEPSTALQCGSGTLLHQINLFRSGLFNIISNPPQTTGFNSVSATTMW